MSESKQVNFRLSAVLLARVDRLAEHQGRDRAELFREALHEYIGKTRIGDVDNFFVDSTSPGVDGTPARRGRPTGSKTRKTNKKSNRSRRSR